MLDEIKKKVFKAKPSPSIYDENIIKERIIAPIISEVEEIRFKKEQLRKRVVLKLYQTQMVKILLIIHLK